MERRQFFSAMATIAAAAAAGVEVDVDRLLWVPGRKTIFLPPPPRPLISVDWSNYPSKAMWTITRPVYDRDGELAGLETVRIMSVEEFNSWEAARFRGLTINEPVLPVSQPEYWFGGRRAGKTAYQRMITEGW